MKKLIALVLALVCGLCLVACANSKTETVSFHGKTYNKAELSEETLEWLEWYNGLSEAEQCGISFIPYELLDIVEEAPAETE